MYPKRGVELTKVVSQDWIADTDMSRNALVKASISKDSKCRRKVLFPVEPLLLQGRELRV